MSGTAQRWTDHGLVHQAFNMLLIHQGDCRPSAGALHTSRTLPNTHHLHFAAVFVRPVSRMQLSMLPRVNKETRIVVAHSLMNSLLSAGARFSSMSVQASRLV